MTADSRTGLLPAPTVAEWHDRLEEAGTVELMPFTGVELASVGAGSPIRGLVADQNLVALDGDDLEASLQQARQRLMARGYAGRPSPTSADPGRLRIPLGGDLAGIVAVRREPALVAVVSAGPPELVRRPGGDPAASAVVAVLHGVAAAGADGGLLGLLEETTTGRGLHLFSLCTPAAQAQRILGAWRELEEDGPAAVSVHVFVPDPETPRHVQLALQPGVARTSSDGVSWERSVPDYEWSELFEGAVRL